MSLDFERIVSLDTPPPDAAPRPRPRRVRRRSPLMPTRREFLKGTLAVGAGIGIAALGIFPPARLARASNHRQIWDGRDHGFNHECDGLGTWVLNDDCAGCNRPRKHCCCNSEGYHKSDGTNYKVRPNQCKDGVYDGWLWRTSECCGNSRKNQRWRCHDGWFCANPPCGNRHCGLDEQNNGQCESNEWIRSICKHRLSSGTAC